VKCMMWGNGNRYAAMFGAIRYSLCSSNIEVIVIVIVAKTIIRETIVKRSRCRCRN
jgi:hypothetical protein